MGAPEDPLPEGSVDQALMERIASGDRAALGILYDRHASMALALTLRILRDRTEAEDAVHDAFVAVWERCGQFVPGRGSVVAWLMSTVRNLAIDRVRRRGRRARLEADILGHEPQPKVASPEDLSVGAFAARDVGRAVRELPKDRREILEAAFFEGLTYAQIAERQGVPVGTIKSRAARALAALRKTLELTDLTADSGGPPLTGPTALR